MPDSIPECEYIAHDDGVHEFIFHKASRKALDWHMDKLIEIRDGLPEGTTLCYLLNMVDGGMPPIRYALSRVRAASKDTPFFKDVVFACLMKDSSLIGTFGALGNSVIASSSLKFFKANEADAAHAWLREKMTEAEPN